MVKMSGVLDYMQLCRLCLVKDKVNVPIFGDATDVRQIFLKITACLPVKISQDDNLPKNICDSCLYKVDLLYQFYNTTANAEKQLIQWLDEIGVDVNIKSAGLPPQLSHAHPHSMKVDSLVKEERHEAGEGQHLENSAEYITSPQLYVGYNQQFAQANTSHENNGEHNNTPVKRTRGRPSSIKKDQTPATTTSTNKLDEDESMDEDSSDRGGMQDDSDDSMEETGGRIAKEEAESEEEYDVNAESLEPTTFVGVPNEAPCDADQPGPSGLNKPAVSSTDTGHWNQGTGQKTAVLYGILTTSIPVKIEEIMVSQNHKCNICFKEFELKKYLNRHLERHVEKKVPCDICGLKFKTSADMKSHSIRVHEKRKPHKCEACDDSFMFRYELTHHERYHLKNYTHKCVECDKGFFSLQECNLHLDSVHRGIRYICFPCNKSFKSMQYHKQHMKEHDPNYINIAIAKKCKVCGEGFKIPSVLRAHIKATHGKPKKVFICDICGKTTTTNTSLITHKRLHNGEKPYVCQTCGKAFASEKVMKVHLRTHTKERPYFCKECGKTFTQRSTLVIHMRYHTGERPYKCTFCEKEFVSKNLLKMHTKVHGTALADIKT